MRMQGWALNLGMKLDRLHPVLTAVLVSLLFAAGGVVAALYTINLIRTRSSGTLLAAVAGGTLIGLAGSVIWAYSFAQEFLVPVWLGRVLLVLTLVTMIGILGAVTGNPLIQAVSVSMLATRLLPQAVFTIVQARKDVRHPETRNIRVMRAMTMASVRRPPLR